MDEEREHQKRQELVGKLTACEAIKKRSLRDMVVELLREDISSRIERFPRDDADILSIVTTCGNYDWGIEELVEILHEFERDSKQMQALEQYLETAYRSITIAQLRRLRSILEQAQIPSDDLIDVCIELYTKNNKIPLPRWFGSLRDKTNETEIRFLMLQYLANTPEWNNDAPILLFAADLISYLDKKSTPQARPDLENTRKPSVQEQIRIWIETTALELNTIMPRMQTLTLSKTRESPLYLLIKLGSNTDGKSFSIRGWLLDSTYRNPRYSYVHDTPITVEEIPDAVSELLLQSCRYLRWGDIYQLIVEFCLPRSLIFTDVDHWLVKTYPKSDKHKKVKRIGLRHPVVVRLSERADKDMWPLWPLWEGKWKYFHQHLSQKSAEAIFPCVICDIEDCEGQSDKLDSMLIPAHIVCLALTFVPHEISPDKLDLLDAILSNGIPIALWHRRCVFTPEQLHRMFMSFLSENQLSELPILVWNKRLEGAVDEKHFAYHLTLLWDDPTRKPPDTADEAVPFNIP